MVVPVYRLYLPQRQRSSVIFDTPHSGHFYPPDLQTMSCLDERMLRSSEDAFLDKIFAFIPKRSAPLLTAVYARTYVDLNRSAIDMDPKLIHPVVNKGIIPSYVQAGLGVIPRVVAHNQPIYRGKITLHDAQSRLRKVWYPYHACLSSVVQHTKQKFNHSILFTLHSMPSTIWHEKSTQSALYSTNGYNVPDVVLGDLYGKAASAWVIDAAHHIFSNAGLKTVRNKVFAGGYTTRHYGKPACNQHVVQIEINRALYMDEKTIQPNAKFNDFCQLMDKIATQLIAIDDQSKYTKTNQSSIGH